MVRPAILVTFEKARLGSGWVFCDQSFGGYDVPYCDKIKKIGPFWNPIILFHPC